MGDLGQFK
jgi:hypothetical protein